MQKVAFVVSILFLTGACQQATLIPDEEAEKIENARNTDEEAPKDSTNVDVNVTGNGWDEPINVGFEFGGEQKGDNE